MFAFIYFLMIWKLPKVAVIILVMTTTNTYVPGFKHWKVYMWCESLKSHIVIQFYFILDYYSPADILRTNNDLSVGPW